MYNAIADPVVNLKSSMSHPQEWYSIVGHAIVTNETIKAAKLKLNSFDASDSIIDCGVTLVNGKFEATRTTFTRDITIYVSNGDIGSFARDCIFTGKLTNKLAYATDDKYTLSIQGGYIEGGKGTLLRHVEITTGTDGVTCGGYIIFTDVHFTSKAHQGWKNGKKWDHDLGDNSTISNNCYVDVPIRMGLNCTIHKDVEINALIYADSNLSIGGGATVTSGICASLPITITDVDKLIDGNSIRLDELFMAGRAQINECIVEDARIEMDDINHLSYYDSRIVGTIKLDNNMSAAVIYYDSAEHSIGRHGRDVLPDSSKRLVISHLVGG